MDHAIYVGIDVAKAQLDIAVRPSAEQWVSRHDEEGIATLVGRLHALRPALIVLEATGGREATLAALATAGLSVAVVNPRRGATGQDRCPRRPAPRALRRVRCPTHRPRS